MQDSKSRRTKASKAKVRLFDSLIMDELQRRRGWVLPSDIQAPVMRRAVDKGCIIASPLATRLQKMAEDEYTDVESRPYSTTTTTYKKYFEYRFKVSAPECPLRAGKDEVGFVHPAPGLSPALPMTERERVLQIIDDMVGRLSYLELVIRDGKP